MPTSRPHFRFSTMAQLMEAIKNHRQALINACAHVDGKFQGEKFIERYIEYIMEFAFRGRLYPRQTTVHKLVSFCSLRNAHY